MDKIKILFASLIIIFAFSSCKTVTSVNPIDLKTKSSVDQTLPGLWYGYEDKEKTYVMIRTQSDGYLNITGTDADFKYDEGKIIAYPSILGDYRFLNILSTSRDSDKIDPTKGYFFLFYQIKNSNTIELRNLNFNYFVNAVEKKKIKGEVKYSVSADKKSKTPADVILSDTSENIRKFFRENKKDDLLEKKIMILNRINQ